MGEGYRQGYEGRERAQSYDRLADVVIPRRREMLAAMVTVLPFAEDSPLRVLDLGSGSGAVAETVLQRYPQATIVCLDKSAEMLDLGVSKHAQRAGRIQFLQRDLEDPAWSSALAGPWHAVLSCMAVHLLPDDAKQALYRQAHEMLAPGGWFVSADRLRAASPYLDGVYHELWLKHIVQQTQDVLGKEVTIATVRERQRSLDAAAGLRCATLEQNLSWLQQVGFAGVECYWKDWQRAVFGGSKEETTPEEG